MTDIYWLDSDVLIQAANDAYPFDVGLGFWDYLSDRISNGTIYVPEEVKLELVTKDDAVSEWVTSQPDGFIVQQDADVQLVYQEIADFVATQPFGEPHKRGFLRRADGWLIVHAQVTSGIVITRERRTGHGSEQVKIPNVCDQFGVTSIHPTDFLRKEGVTFVRGD